VARLINIFAICPSLLDFHTRSANEARMGDARKPMPPEPEPPELCPRERAELSRQGAKSAARGEAVGANPMLLLVNQGERHDTWRARSAAWTIGFNAQAGFGLPRPQSLRTNRGAGPRTAAPKALLSSVEGRPAARSAGGDGTPAPGAPSTRAPAQ
jgi:hypothetical protein